jgi:hypothetical protein
MYAEQELQNGIPDETKGCPEASACCHCQVEEAPSSSCQVHEEQEVPGKILCQGACKSQSKARQVHEKQEMQGCIFPQKACCF